MELDSLKAIRREVTLHKKICQWFIKNLGCDISNFKLLSAEDCSKLPSQRSNCSECGIFMLSFMMAVCFDNAFYFNLDDMPRMRKNLGDTILISSGKQYL